MPFFTSHKPYKLNFLSYEKTVLPVAVPAGRLGRHGYEPSPNILTMYSGNTSQKVELQTYIVILGRIFNMLNINLTPAQVFT